MAGVSDKELVKQTGFPAGINNVAPEQSLPRDENGAILAGRSLVNVDLVDGKPRTRAGRTKRIEGAWHSPGKLTAARAMFGVVDGDLVQTDGDSVLQVVRAGVGPLYINYVEVNGDLIWSNGEVIRRIRGADLTDQPLWIDCPGTPEAEGYGTGALEPGDYRVAMTWFDDFGRESGADGIAIAEVAAGQGIRVFGIPTAPEGAVSARIYVSTCNGDELYAAKDISTLASNVLVTAGDVRNAKKALETLWLKPMPPVSMLRYGNGRLMGVEGRNTVHYSEALSGLHHSDNYARNGAEVTLLQPMDKSADGNGVWLADHKNTYWVQGDNPRTWRRVIKDPNAAIPGVALLVPGTAVGMETTAEVLFYASADGVFCVGTAGGVLTKLAERRFVLPDAESGAVMFREVDGVRQLAMSLLTRGTNQMAIGDKVSATVTKHY